VAEENPAPAEIDVDSLDDAAFDKLKADMHSSADVVVEEKPAETTTTEETKAQRQRDEQGRFAKSEETATGEEDDAEPRSETVPHGQFHRERERRKQAEARAKEIEDNYSRLMERTNQLLSTTAQIAQPQQQEQQQPAGPPKGDPMAMLEWLTERVQQQEITQQQAQQYAYQEGYRQESLRQLANIEAQFRTTTPDYDAALQYMAESRDAELQLAYPMSTMEQRSQFILREWENLVSANMEAGRNPVQQIYELAKRRGYTPTTQAPQTQPTSAAGQIAAREEARKASMSLGSTGGGITNTGAITPEQLLEMSDAEFDAYKKKHGSVARAFQS